MTQSRSKLERPAIPHSVLEFGLVDTSYKQLVDEVDRMTAALNAKYAAHLQCRSGCSGCCHHHLSVFRVEAEALAEAVQALPPSIRARVEVQARELSTIEANEATVRCPLLIDDKCAVYQTRPIICRTQGLPLLMTALDDVAEVDWCPLNFTSPEATDDLDESHLVPLDSLNLKLAAVNLLRSRERGLDDARSGDRLSIADIILAPDEV